MTDRRYLKLKDDIAHFGDNYPAADATIRATLARLEGIRTREDAFEAVADALSRGSFSPMLVSAEQQGRKQWVVLTLAYDFLREVTPVDRYGTAALLERAGFTADEAEAVALKAWRVWEPFSQACGLTLPTSRAVDGVGYAESLERYLPVSSSRAERLVPGAVWANFLMESLGVDANHRLVDPKVASGVAVLEEADLDDLKAFLQAMAVVDYLHASEEVIAEYNALTHYGYTKGLLCQLADYTYFNYPLSHAYAKQYVTAERCAAYEVYCEEIREAMSQRIDRLDWMSHTTKAKAQEKLAAMRFHIGAPASWVEEGLPRMDGTCLVEDLYQMRASRAALSRALLELPTEEAEFHTGILNRALTEANAYEVFFNNSLFVYPCWLYAPFYDPTYSDAYNYGVSLTTFGHEIVHGFDSNGARYDKDGNMNNWWTVSDRMEFEERCGLLVDCYNHLEVLPDEMPGYYCPGKQTLNENIADIGGVLIAWQAYVNRLAREGYSGGESLKQERRFFQALAEKWRMRYTATYVQSALIEAKIPHAMPKERINGVVMNCDRWYELFDVQQGDKLYLPVSRRTYLW